LPTDRLYTPSHFWLHEISPGLWRVGFTRFATRMLGDIVELDFEVEPGSAVTTGQMIGWIEGFKALSDIYAVAEGTFDSVNPVIRQNAGQVDRNPYGDGWLYTLKGVPDPRAVDAQGYAGLLDLAIDKMQGKYDPGADPGPDPGADRDE